MDMQEKILDRAREALDHLAPEQVADLLARLVACYWTTGDYARDLGLDQLSGADFVEAVGVALEDSNVGTELPSLESLICEDDRAELIQQALALSVAVRKADRVSRSVGVPEEIGHVLAIARSIARIANG